jgi:hypothetical protein
MNQENSMKRLSISLLCFAFCIFSTAGVFAEEFETSETLPLIVGQMCDQANTIIMWHDINDDGQADYKATYIFKNGKLHQLSKNQVSPDDLGFLIRR